jgi:hypothetical protein
VRDDTEPPEWEWGRVVTTVEKNGLTLLKVAKEGWGDEAFVWHAWRRSPGEPQILSDPSTSSPPKIKMSNRKSAVEKGAGLRGFPSSGLALVSCPLHEALVYANSLPEETDVALYFAPMVSVGGPSAISPP